MTTSEHAIQDAQVTPTPSDTAHTGTFPIVGIGASAGGLAALEALVNRLSAPARQMAFVVLQHRSRAHASNLTGLLARRTALHVADAEDGMRAEANHLYVAPPDADLAIHEGILRVLPPQHSGPRPSIDAFLRSLAADRGSRAIGVILSGAGNDGTLGLQAIKLEGGITLVQEPKTADYPSMPQSALDAGCADICVSPAEIADELNRLSEHPYVARAAPRALKPFDASQRAHLFILLRDAFGVDFAAYRQATVERRIARRMALHKLDRLEDYVKYAQSDPAELKALHGELVISVTRFFRDPESFEALKSLVFPKLLQRSRPQTPIRIWVAGCSTGEEAFSLAISWLEHLGERESEYKLQIFATDIDEASLARARRARYPRSIEADVSADRLQRFFSRSEAGYQIKRAVRDMVVFARHRLGKDPPFSRIDLMSCRNVLIYMQPLLQKGILRVLHYALNPDGFLLLGTSESVGDSSDLFALLDSAVKLYTKKSITSALAEALPGVALLEPRGVLPLERRAPIRTLQLADRKVLEHYGPPGVVVDERFEILHYLRKTGRFLEPAAGVPTLDVLQLARHELVPELAIALRAALSEGIQVLSRPVDLRIDDELVTVVLDVIPLPDPDSGRKALLVLFAEQPPAHAATGEREASETAPESRLPALERELATTKEYLQIIIEELETTNEELQHSNEELQTTNEEFQTTNEELETSREELRASNDDLLAYNRELQKRIAQVGVSNDDLHSCLQNTRSPIVLVDANLRIRRLSLQAERLLGLGQHDIGRAIGCLRTAIQAPDLEQTVSVAIGQVLPTRQRVRSTDGSWYTMCITPARTAANAISGATIEFVETAADPGDEVLGAST